MGNFAVSFVVSYRKKRNIFALRVLKWHTFNLFLTSAGNTIIFQKKKNIISNLNFFLKQEILL